VILLGDAAYVMLFAGPGANFAWADGTDRGLALTKAKTDSELLEHVREYKTAMQILGILWSDSRPTAAKVRSSV
jgi:hypothetical protein